MANDRQVKFKGTPMPVLGDEVRVGEPLPSFALVGTDLQPVTEDVLQGKVGILSVVPSLDTPVCSKQTRRFNEEAARLSDKVVILTVSRDLPFAQKRWCGAEGVEGVKVASDYKDRTFGKSFGVELPELGLLARSVFVVDQKGVVQYAEYVPEITEEPRYDQVLEKTAQLLG